MNEISNIPDEEFRTMQETFLREFKNGLKTSTPEFKVHNPENCRFAADTGEPVIQSKPCRGHKILCGKENLIVSPETCRKYCKFFEPKMNAVDFNGATKD